MKGHTSIGRDIIDNMLEEFSFCEFLHVDMLRSIVELYHEAIDGSGYPYGLKGQRDSDRGTNLRRRGYFRCAHQPPSLQTGLEQRKACATLQEMAGTKLDRDCVMALLNNMEKLQEIQTHFGEETGNSGL